MLLLEPTCVFVARPKGVAWRDRVELASTIHTARLSKELSRDSCILITQIDILDDLRIFSKYTPVHR